MSKLIKKHYLDKIHEDVAQAFHIISSALLNSKMCVDAGVSGSPGEVLVFSVGNVLVCSRITVFLGKPEVDNIHKVSFLTQTPDKKCK